MSTEYIDCSHTPVDTRDEEIASRLRRHYHRQCNPLIAYHVVLHALKYNVTGGVDGAVVGLRLTHHSQLLREHFKVPQEKALALALGEQEVRLSLLLAEVLRRKQFLQQDHLLCRVRRCAKQAEDQRSAVKR